MFRNRDTVAAVHRRRSGRRGCSQREQLLCQPRPTPRRSRRTICRTRTSTATFSALKDLKPPAAKGKGNVAVILPDTTSSTRYTEFDAPLLDKAFKNAGLKSSQFIVQNGQGSDATFITDAQADITAGRKGPADRPGGLGHRRTRSRATPPPMASRSSTTTAYARWHPRLLRQLQQRLRRHAARPGPGVLRQGVEGANPSLASPKVIVMRGAPTDNNATLFARATSGPRPAVQERQVEGCRESGRNVGPADGGDRVPAGVHGQPDRERPAHPRTTRTRRRSSATCSPGRQAVHLPGDRPGRDASSVCRTSSPATSAARSTSRSSWRLRRPRRSRCTCGPA